MTNTKPRHTDTETNKCLWIFVWVAAHPALRGRLPLLLLLFAFARSGERKYSLSGRTWPSNTQDKLRSLLGVLCLPAGFFCVYYLHAFGGPGAGWIFDVVASCRPIH